MINLALDTFHINLLPIVWYVLTALCTKEDTQQSKFSSENTVFANWIVREGARRVLYHAILSSEVKHSAKFV